MPNLRFMLPHIYAISQAFSQRGPTYYSAYSLKNHSAHINESHLHISDEGIVFVVMHTGNLSFDLQNFLVFISHIALSVRNIKIAILVTL